MSNTPAKNALPQNPAMDVTSPGHCVDNGLTTVREDLYGIAGQRPIKDDRRGRLPTGTVKSCEIADPDHGG